MPSVVKSGFFCVDGCVVRTAFRRGRRAPACIDGESTFHEDKVRRRFPLSCCTMWRERYNIGLYEGKVIPCRRFAVTCIGRSAPPILLREPLH